jgi:hypothetical protein
MVLKRRLLGLFSWKFANLRFSDLQIGTPKTFTDLRQRNKSKDLRVLNLRIFK